jgi:hypothetical protein
MGGPEFKPQYGQEKEEKEKKKKNAGQHSS